MRYNYVITDKRALIHWLHMQKWINCKLPVQHLFGFKKYSRLFKWGFGTIMNKMHAINLDIDGLCQILLCVRIFIISIKSFNSIVALHCVILTENLILNSFFYFLMFQFKLNLSDIYFYSTYSFFHDWILAVYES